MYGQTSAKPALRVLTMLLWMLSCSCLCCLLLAACSGSQNRPNPGAKDAGSGRAETVGGGNATAVTGEGEGDMIIEKAFLRRGDGGDEIVVRGRLGNAPDAGCILTEGTREEAEKRASAEIKEGATEANVHSLWSKEPGGKNMPAESGAFMIVFRENPNPPEEAGDPRRTPFFTYCAGGITFKKMTADEAHVQGTPKAP